MTGYIFTFIIVSCRIWTLEKKACLLKTVNKCKNNYFWLSGEIRTHKSLSDRTQYIV